jgi:hypothetical protein
VTSRAGRWVALVAPSVLALAGCTSAVDPRVARFADLLAFNPDSTPEPGATCENPGFGFDPSRTD